MLEHSWDSLWSEWTSSLPERQATARLLQLISPAPAPVSDLPIRPQFTEPSTISADRPIPIVDAPVIPQGDGLSGPIHESLESDAAARTITTMLGGNPVLSVTLNTIVAEAAANFAVLYSDDFESGLVVNLLNKTLLEGGPGNYPELGIGSNDLLVLNGDFSAGSTMPMQPAGLDRIVLGEGNDYNLAARDGNVAPGGTLTIDGMPLGDGNRVIFDGSEETDGSFDFFGSQSGDTFIGGAGDDRIFGLGGADTLAGGDGADRFVYTGASDSTGDHYDTLADFQPGVDHIDLLGNVAGWGAPITGGALSHASFDSDLSGVMAGLGAAQATWFAPDGGDLAGTIFLVVDANGIAGYQAGEDYVFAVGGTPLADLTGHTDIFV